jgi:hypothetical protein
MRRVRILYFLAFLSLVPFPAVAQTTQVTGQVKDANGIPYAGATMKAGLVFAGTPVSNPTVTINTLSQCKANGFGSAPCQVPFQPTNGPFTLDGSGNIPGGGITLQDNTQVTPAGTTWSFTVNTPGNPPPLGTGAQTCSATLTISGASQVISSSFSACPALSNVSGLSTVSTVSGLNCTPGLTANVNVTVNGIGYGEFFCAKLNVWLPVNPSQTVSPYVYGAVWDLKYSYQITTVASNATITTTGADAPFSCPGAVFPCSSGGDAGKNFFAYESPYAASCSVANCSSPYQTLVSPTTITTVNSANSITVASSGAVLNSYTPTVNTLGIGVWYTQDDRTALNAAGTAAWTTPGYCYAVQVPEGAGAIGGPIFNIPASSLSYPCGGYVVTAGLSGIDISQNGPQLFGQGAWNSLFVPTPGYNYAGCTFGSSGHGCNLTTPNLSVMNVGFNGMGQSTASGNPTVNLVELNGSTAGGSCTGSTLLNFVVANWLVADANAVGLDLGRNACGDPVYSNLTSEMAGGVDCQFNSAGTVVTINQAACFGNTVRSVNIVPAANSTAPMEGIINTFGGYYSQSNGNQIVQVQGGGAGIWNSKGEFITCAFTSVACAALTQLSGGAGTVVNIDGDDISSGPTATGGQAIWVQGVAGNQFHIRNSTISSTGTGSLLQNTVAGTRYYDEGGNTYTNGGTTKSVFTGLMVADGHSLKGTCTGVATASSTLGLYGTGPNVTATTCTSTNIGSGVPMEGARTLTFLVVSATAGGVNASSGVVTVLKNGGATTMTCTLGTGTACVDDQHQISVADGDLISIQFTTQAADTLAGVKALVDWSN